MKVVIIACMTCLFAVALTMGGPIRRQASQSEKTVPIRGTVTLLCPFVPDVTWQYVYWKKNDQTIYSLEVQSNTPTTNDTRYEGSNHATRLMIKDLKKTDTGIYHCKVATLATSDFIKEGGQLLLSVTDQEEGLFTTSPSVSFKTSTKIPPEPTEVKTIIFSIIVSILLLIITLCLIFKYWKRVTKSKFVRPCRKLARTRNTSTPVPAAPNPEDVELQGGIMSDPANIPPRVPDSTIPDQISPSTPLLLDESAQQGSQANVCDQADMPSRAQDIRPTTSRRLYASAPNDTNFRSTPLPYSSAHLQQGSPATSKLHPSDPCGPIFHSTPLPCSSAQASKRTSTPLAPEVSNREIRDEEGTHGSDDVDVDDRPEENSNASQALTSDAEETPLPPVGPLLIEDLCAENEKGRRLVVKRLRKVLHSFVELHEEEHASQKGYNYSASIEKYLSSGKLGVQKDVLRDVEYFLDALDTIPVDRNRDVCEILLTMPVNQQSDRSMYYLYKDNFLQYDEDDQVRAANEKIVSTLKEKMELVLSESKTREDALNYISAIILEALVKISGSASLSQSLSQHTNSRNNQSAIETEQEASPQSQSDKASKPKDDNLIQFWLSKVTRLRLKFQRKVIEDLEDLNHDADSSSEEKTTEEEKNTDPSKSTDREPQPPKYVWPPKMELNRLSKEQLITVIQELSEPTSNNRVSAQASRLKELIMKEIFDRDEKKTMGRPDIQNDDAKEGKNTILNKNTDQNKKSIEIHGEKENG